MNISGFIPVDTLTKLNSMTGTNNTYKLDSIVGNDEDKSTNNDTAIDFSSILKDKLNEVNDKQVSADNMTNQFITGDDVDVHQVMLSTQEAQMSLQLAVQIRNKIVESYQELNRMQV